MGVMKKFLLIASIVCSLTAHAFQDQNVYLPDGTQIKIVKDKAYYNCKGKIVPLPDGRYLLADGSKLTVRKSRIVEFAL